MTYSDSGQVVVEEQARWSPFHRAFFAGYLCSRGGDCESNLLSCQKYSGQRGEVARPGASIYDVLQQQLGLKLQAATVPVDVLVIDHAERTPKGN